MVDTLRKNALPPWLDKSDFGSIFAYIASHPTMEQSIRVERLLGLFCALGCNPTGYRSVRLLVALRTELDRYRWVRKVFQVPGGVRSHFAPSPEVERYDEWEYKAVQDLLDLTNVPGGLSRLRKCASCTRWILASKKTERFCTTKCRVFEYDNDPVRKIEKLKAMRKLREDKKLQALNPRSGVGLGKMLVATKEKYPARAGRRN